MLKHPRRWPLDHLPVRMVWEQAEASGVELGYSQGSGTTPRHRGSTGLLGTLFLFGVGSE